MQNGLIERFNRTYREEVLDCYVFEILGEVCRMTADWINRWVKVFGVIFALMIVMLGFMLVGGGHGPGAYL